MQTKKLLLLMLVFTLTILPNFVSAKVADKVEEKYTSFSGMIDSVDKKYGDITILVNINNDKNNSMIVHIQKDTLLFDMTDTRENKEVLLEKGATVEVFFLENTPIAASLPAQLMNPYLVLIKNSDYTTKLDKFDSELVSSDGKLKLNVKDNATEYKDSLLLVFYKESTKSIPAIANPYKVIKLHPENEVALLSKDGVLFAPLRKVFETMNYKVDWNAEQKLITIKQDDKAATLNLDKKSYTDFNEKDIKLEAEPFIMDGRTFVPVSYMQKNLKLNNLEIKDAFLIIK